MTSCVIFCYLFDGNMETSLNTYTPIEIMANTCMFSSIVVLSK